MIRLVMSCDLEQREKYTNKLTKLSKCCYCKVTHASLRNDLSASNLQDVFDLPVMIEFHCCHVDAPVNHTRNRILSSEFIVDIVDAPV